MSRATQAGLLKLGRAPSCAQFVVHGIQKFFVHLFKQVPNEDRSILFAAAPPLCAPNARGRRLRFVKPRERRRLTRAAGIPLLRQVG